MRVMCQCGVGANRCTVKLQGTACVSTLTYPMFLQWARGQALLILPRIGRISPVNAGHKTKTK